MSSDPELARWCREWQAQQDSSMDVDRLRCQTMKANRREQFSSALELVISLVALMLCARAFFLVGPESVMRWVLPLLAAVIIIATARNVLMRYRQWKTSTLDVASLVALERRRLARRVRYWRESAWIVTVLWSALAVVGIVDQVINPDDLDRHARWFLSLSINAVVVITTVLCAYFIKRRANTRQVWLDSLLENRFEDE